MAREIDLVHKIIYYESSRVSDVGTANAAKNHVLVFVKW
jgi:hypothetical protein